MMGNPEIIGAILGSDILSSVITFFFTKKRYNTEVDSNVIENMQKSLAFYQQLCDDNNKRLNDVLDKNDSLNNRLDEVLKKNEELNKQVLSLQQEILDIYKFLGVRNKEELNELRNSIDDSLKDTTEVIRRKRKTSQESV